MIMISFNDKNFIFEQKNSTMELNKIDQLNYKASVIYLLPKTHDLRGLGLAETEILYTRQRLEADKSNFVFNKFFGKYIILSFFSEDDDRIKLLDKARKNAKTVCAKVNEERLEAVQVKAVGVDKDIVLAFVEGLLLANYQFLKYFTKDLDKKRNTLHTIEVEDERISQDELDQLLILSDAVNIVRDLVNEPYPALNSENLPERIRSLAQEAGFDLDVLHRKQIESLRMGGLMAVNRGSKYEPTFSVLSYKSDNAKNNRPIVLVGKGIVFDSGGLNLKPTGYIEDMKTDMAGAAAVIGTVYAAAKMRLPVYLIGLVPSTDNAISDRSYAPGEVLTMHNSTTVEILNTDAEGRLILADALSYAQKYEPQLVIDLATLTGSAMRAVGPYASAMFAKTDQEIAQKLIDTGLEVFERLIQFPLWNEYDEMLKSDIADLKNIGGSNAGLITAAKFLEHFTDYPWIHLDIAPNAHLTENDVYFGKGATGIGVRLLTRFLQKL